MGFGDGKGDGGGGCGGGGHALANEATSSQETSSFDLIIWEGQSDFVDEESL